MTIRTFIIDDEAPARRELRYLLEQIAGADVVGEAANGSAALKGIRETRPQLIFLDIQMPGMTGLELAHFLCELPHKPLLIFATAFDEYALEAFEVDAIDYLRKPFTQERVAKAFAKAVRALSAETAPTAMEARETFELCRKIPLYRGETIIPTAPDRIIFIRSEEGELFVHAVDGRYRTRCTLNELEQKLGVSGFVRPHRSFLVNINHVREVVPWFNGSYKLIMDDRERSEVPVSRYNVKDLKRHFDI
jgi:two-component system, LytTR family, response regulator LytT